MLGITIPVVTLQHDGTRTADTINGKPCVEMGFTFEMSAIGNFQLAGIKRTYGHIDTGCDYIAIDESFLDTAPLIPIRQLTLTTPNAVTIGNVYRGTIVFFGAEVMAQQVEFVTVPKSDYPYKIILGRSFLHNTTFVYNGAKGIDKIAISPGDGPKALDPIR